MPRSLLAITGALGTTVLAFLTYSATADPSPITRPTTPASQVAPRPSGYPRVGPSQTPCGPTNAPSNAHAVQCAATTNPPPGLNLNDAGGVNTGH